MRIFKYFFISVVYFLSLYVIAVYTAVTVMADSDSSGQYAHGKGIYQSTCVACHGANGEGKVPGAPDFTDMNGPLNKSDEILIKHAMEGFQSPGSPMPMPPKGGNPDLTEKDISAVIIYIRGALGKSN